LWEAWGKKFQEYKEKYPELADHLDRMQRRELPVGWDKNIPTFPPSKEGLYSLILFVF
jgi:transketolase